VLLESDAHPYNLASQLPGRHGWPNGDHMSGNRNVLYLIIGALIVGIGILGYNLYQAKKEPSGLQINVGPDGLKIQNK
jgi:hypothetical protein